MSSCGTQWMLCKSPACLPISESALKIIKSVWCKIYFSACSVVLCNMSIIWAPSILTTTCLPWNLTNLER